jgi:signal transduction histidine kinase
MTDCQEQLALARRQLEAVQRISEALYSTTDTEALQRLALQTAMDVVGADAGSMLLYDADHNALVFRIALGPVADTLTGTSLDLNIGSGIARQVFLSGTSLITQNAPEDADHIGTVDQRTGYQTQSLMTVPLRRTDGGSQPYGIVQLLNKKNGRFDDSDVAVTEIMGSLVAMAVRNAVLGQRARLAAVAYSVGEISHDIGNMLTYILPYVQTLELYIAEVRTGKPGALEELDAFYLEVVSSVADGVEQVELRAKEIARAVKGEVAPLAFERGCPLNTARQIVRAFSATAQRHGISLTATGDAELEAVYDHGRLYNSLYNLVGNALPETPDGGSITLNVAPCAEDPLRYIVSVADTGRGMPEEVRAKLFTDASRSTKPGGTGLGTQIVRRTVEQHGGSVWVESVPGAGTTITLSLPIVPEAQSQPAIDFSSA